MIKRQKQQQTKKQKGSAERGILVALLSCGLRNNFASQALSTLTLCVAYDLNC